MFRVGCLWDILGISRIPSEQSVVHVDLKDTRSLKNAPFCPISKSDSHSNSRNTKCITVVRIFVFLDLEQNWTFFKGLDTESCLDTYYFFYRGIFVKDNFIYLP